MPTSVLTSLPPCENVRVIWDKDGIMKIVDVTECNEALAVVVLSNQRKEILSQMALDRVRRRLFLGEIMKKWGKHAREAAREREEEELRGWESSDPEEYNYGDTYLGPVYIPERGEEHTTMNYF